MADSLVSTFEARVAGEPDPARRVEAFVLGLADAIKATSNDQNVQRLSRELRGAAAELAEAVVPTRA